MRLIGITVHLPEPIMRSASLHQIKVGPYYSKEAQYTSRQLTSILEPILTLVLGISALAPALAIFLPMWNLIAVFKGSQAA